MSAQFFRDSSHSGGVAPKYGLTLAPLRDHGPAAIAPDLAAGIIHISLSGVVLVWHNAYNEVTIRKADDLFACAARDGKYYDTIPKGADLVQATLDFEFTNSPRPHFVHIIPPDKLTLEDPSDAPRVLALLSSRGFRAAQKLALALFLAGACLTDACTAEVFDDDPEEQTAGFTVH